MISGCRSFLEGLSVELQVPVVMLEQNSLVVFEAACLQRNIYVLLERSLWLSCAKVQLIRICVHSRVPGV